MAEAIVIRWAEPATSDRVPVQVAASSGWAELARSAALVRLVRLVASIRSVASVRLVASVRSVAWVRLMAMARSVASVRLVALVRSAASVDQRWPDWRPRSDRPVLARSATRWIGGIELDRRPRSDRRYWPDWRPRSDRWRGRSAETPGQIGDAGPDRRAGQIGGIGQVWRSRSGLAVLARSAASVRSAAVASVRTWSVLEDRWHRWCIGGQFGDGGGGNLGQGQFPANPDPSGSWQGNGLGCHLRPVYGQPLLQPRSSTIGRCRSPRRRTATRRTGVGTNNIGFIRRPRRLVVEAPSRITGRFSSGHHPAGQAVARPQAASLRGARRQLARHRLLRSHGRPRPHESRGATRNATFPEDPRKPASPSIPKTMWQDAASKGHRWTTRGVIIATADFLGLQGKVMEECARSSSRPICGWASWSSRGCTTDRWRSGH